MSESDKEDQVMMTTKPEALAKIAFQADRAPKTILRFLFRRLMAMPCCQPSEDKRLLIGNTNRIFLALFRSTLAT